MRRVWVMLLLGCGPSSPSDDPRDWVVPSKAYTPVLSEPQWLIPSRLIPDQARPELGSNNNVDIIMHGGRLYFAWRTAPYHFAGTETRLHLMSSEDLGASWKYEHTYFMSTDMREPHFLSLGGRLWFHFFEAGTDMFSFEPKHMWRASSADWSKTETWGEEKEITWDMKTRGGVAYRTSYTGNHYDVTGASDMQVHFSRSKDGTTWEELGVVYRGGVSEVAFEFAADGSLWAVTRNEDGDATGFGSHVCHAEKDALGTWECSAHSDPERYDSPRMFRHGDDLYLVARRDIGGPFDQGRTDLSFPDQKTTYLAQYWTRPKRTALYKLNTEARKVEWLQDFPSCGDTAFPGIARLSAHRFLIANYTSPLTDLDISWVQGQTSEKGTKIYLTTLEFQ